MLKQWGQGPFFVYGMFDPRNGELKYVGKTCNGFARLKSHLAPSRLRTPTLKNNWVKSLLSQGLEPVMEVLEEYPNPSPLLEMEKQAISHYRLMGFPLLNQTDGGDGAVGRVLSRESIEKQASKLRGRSFSASHRVKLSKTQWRKNGPFIHVQSGTIFETQQEAADRVDLATGSVRNCLVYGRMVKGHSFRYFEARSC